MKYLGGIFMTTLNCCSTNCVNNKHGTCKAHEINVNGQGAHLVATQNLMALIIVSLEVH